MAHEKCTTKEIRKVCSPSGKRRKVIRPAKFESFSKKHKTVYKPIDDTTFEDGGNICDDDFDNVDGNETTDPIAFIPRIITDDPEKRSICNIKFSKCKLSLPKLN